MQVIKTEENIITNSAQALMLRRKLEPIMQKDPLFACPSGGEMRCVYFDTVNNRYFSQIENSLNTEESIKLQAMDGGKIIELIYKEKEKDIVKEESLKIDSDICSNILKGKYDVLLNLQEPQAKFFYEKLSRGLFPKALLQYKRCAFSLPLNNIKIMIDTDIRASKSNFDLLSKDVITRPAASLDTAIIKIEYSRFLFEYIKDALRFLKKSPSSYSKYYSAKII